MNTIKQLWVGLLYASGLILLILDSKTAVSGAQEGISMCLNTVIPCLFPFVFFSVMLTPFLTGHKVKILQPIQKLCGIPTGAEQLLILSFLGGYPIGAQAISTSWKNGSLSKENAKRMLGFCNNAGPSFLFGMGGILFSTKSSLFILWAIHILSAFAVGFLLPRNNNQNFRSAKSTRISVVQGLEKSLKSMAFICGWVILFRIILCFMEKWIFERISPNFHILLTGLMELSNGCITLQSSSTEGQRFILMAIFLGFGGLCVFAQTISATGKLGLGYYVPGKVLQGCISFLLSYIMQLFIFGPAQRYIVPSEYILLTVSLIIFTIIFLHRKKIVAFKNKMIYNTKKSQHEEYFHAVS